MFQNNPNLPFPANLMIESQGEQFKLTVNTCAENRRYDHVISLRCISAKDTVNDAATLNVSVLGKVKLDELSKATGVIVVHRLSVPEGLHDGAAKRKNNQTSQIRKPFLHQQIFDHYILIRIQKQILCNLTESTHSNSIFTHLS